MAPMDEAAGHFSRHGWVLVAGLIPREEIVAAQDQLFRIYPRPEEVASGERTERTEPFLAKRPGVPGRRFRDSQFSGLREAPTGDAALDCLALHHRILDLVEALLETTEIRLYQAETFAKYHGSAHYEQPLHIDETNHTLLSPRSDGRYRQVQLFLYLCDVTEANGATRVVSRERTASISKSDLFFSGSGPVQLDELETVAEGPTGSVLAYSADTVHRGAAMTEPGSGRFLLNLGYRAAGVDWVGAMPWPRRAMDPLVSDWLQTLDPRQLAAVGFPPPGHDYWDTETLAAAGLRYPHLDLGPWRAALPVSPSHRARRQR
jgi:ectoine hydroxylase-related dioxygenase (phytanoyl-CoA dioxygenase family)